MTIPYLAKIEGVNSLLDSELPPWRAVTRRGQMAVRLALGASRSQIVVEALIESVLLAVGGAVVGLVVAMGAARLLLSLAFAGATMLPIDIMPSPLVRPYA